MKYYVSSIVKFVGNKYTHENPYKKYGYVHENTYDHSTSNIEIKMNQSKKIENLSSHELIRMEDYSSCSTKLLDDDVVALCVCDGHGSMKLGEDVVFGAYECSKWMTMHILCYLEYYHEFVCSLKKQSHLQINKIVEHAFEFAQTQYIDYIDYYVTHGSTFDGMDSHLTTKKITKQIKKKLKNNEIKHKTLNLFEYPRNQVETFNARASFPKIFKTSYHPNLRKESQDGSTVKYKFNIPVFSKNGKNYALHSGCTCSLVLCIQGYVFCGNVGDSDCYLFDANNSCYTLFDKHDCDSKSEVKRLEGFSMVDGSYFKTCAKKIYDEKYMQMPEKTKVPVKPRGIQPSRNLGHPIIRHVGITHKPSIKFMKCNLKDVIVVGSDGLWNYLSEKQIEQILKNKKVFDLMDQDGQTIVETISSIIFESYMSIFESKKKRFDNMTFAVILCHLN